EVGERLLEPARLLGARLARPVRRALDPPPRVDEELDAHLASLVVEVPADAHQLPEQPAQNGENAAYYDRESVHDQPSLLASPPFRRCDVRRGPGSTEVGVFFTRRASAPVDAQDLGLRGVVDLAADGEAVLRLEVLEGDRELVVVALRVPEE